MDFRNPDYDQVHSARIARLKWLRDNEGMMAPVREQYRADPASFINDWGVTSDPRNKAKGLPIEVPFVLFPRQREMVQFVVERMQSREPGLIEKSRDCGASWLIACLAATMCLFDRGVVIGFGSATEIKLDRSGDPDTLFWKIRFFLSHLPPEFRGSWDETRNSAHLRITFPDTGSAITGEAGDNIGRGDRTSAFFIDESAHVERPQLIEASLASNTDSRFDVSTPAGRANAFAVKRHSGRVKVFTFRWTEDPRKDLAWYQKQCDLLDPVTLAQEVDLSYDASTEGVLIPAAWAKAAIGAHQALGIEPAGERRGALDVADEGRDRNAFAVRHGIVLEQMSSWSGKNSDIYNTVVKTFWLCESHGCGAFDYDADGLGAGVRGDAVQLNLKRQEDGKSQIDAEPFRGSGAVEDPDGALVEGRLNRDYFANRKAQSWWGLRMRFQATYRAVVQNLEYHADEIISISPDLPELNSLLGELSQPTYSVSQVGKLVVDKTPDGAMSPNLADALMIAYAPLRPRAYFSAAAPAETSVPQTAEPALPTSMDMIFCVLAFADDCAAVIYCALNGPGRGGAFVVLDWDLTVLGPDAPAWVASVQARLVELWDLVGWNRSGIRSVPPRVFSDATTGYGRLLHNLTVPVMDMSERLPPLEGRFAAARPDVVLGRAPFAPCAANKVITHKGITRNFLRELLSRPEPPVNDALANSFATAVLLALVPQSESAPTSTKRRKRGRRE